MDAERTANAEMSIRAKAMRWFGIIGLLLNLYLKNTFLMYVAVIMGFSGIASEFALSNMEENE